MSPTLDAFLRSWPFAPWLLIGLVLSGGIYLGGWFVLHRRDPARWPGGQPAAFLGGLAAVFLALASPVEPFSALLLQVHMVQHLLLMMVAPPLLWLGAPLLPFLRGLPRPIRTDWAGPLFRSRRLRQCFQGLTHPAAALVLFVVVNWLWHIPAAYELALRSTGWHYLQHVCFLGAGLLFWYPVVRPYPSRPTWSLWLLFPYLILADVQNTVLSAFFTFADRVVYPYYAEVPRLGRLSALEDQATAGVLMWVPGSVVFLLPLFAIALRLLYAPRSDRVKRPVLPGARISLPLVNSSPAPGFGKPVAPSFDVLRIPLLGGFLRWRHARLAMQLPLALLAGVLIFDGLRGPQVAPLNLAGVLPWIHWRGLVVLGLLTAGNVFCMACPFQLPRTLARRWLLAGRAGQGGYTWPLWLRSKWPAVLLLILFLWAYEAFALWNSPWLTAWIAIAYFVLAFVIDGLFRGASFCKYLCPIGQFNFVQSLVSPLEVQVRDPTVCATCRTRDCIRGRDGIPGCELQLFQPRKAGNMDCTFCLDCIHACPHDNIGMVAGLPGRDLWRDPSRSGVGQFGKRPDLAVLIVVLVFGAFANAAAMVGPVADWQEQAMAFLGEPSPLLITSLFFLLALLVLPLLGVGAAAFWSRRWGKLTASWVEVATRYSYALVPLGFAMWLAHYSFHFLTSYDMVVPATQRLASELGLTGGTKPQWLAGCCRPVAEWLPRLEILFLDLGLLLSLYTGYRITLAQTTPRLEQVQTLKALAPWAILLLFLFAVGVWLVLQPMQMRGTEAM